VGQTLIFIWQDNNTVLGITTAHCLKNETIEKLRKRPSPTSTNARIVRPVFGDKPQKLLHIPRAIDDYNRFMNDMDRANQLRKNLTVNRPYKRRVWRPLWYYLLDICAINSGLIWDKLHLGQCQKKRGHRRFRENLIQALLSTPYTESTSHHKWSKPVHLPNQEVEGHQWNRLQKRGYCVWCKIHSKEWKPKKKTACSR
jgi:Transposase IS4